ncbi:hypothetical protein HHK36_005294 [Tetracentron sinense]|uniref:Dof zinc finger protein n=1 Tax=Tetracentron sinense TaxID=13715 RepID=A0A834ZKS0_TETSI|nr:hypothetical protein HHK36_005294 [Tetracentron sinense]
MQQERGRTRVEDMKGLQQQQQDRRLKPLQPPDNQQQQLQQQQQQQQPQKCPRCESLNTKFCYYNNYSLSQPRYFCKTCRRYWTQGGTLRNVPVGGGCRKGKRSKRPSSGDNPQNLQQPNSTTTASTSTTVIPTTGPTSAISPAGSGTSIYYSGGGFLSSLAAIQSFNQPMNVGGDFGGSNLALLQGFSLPSFGQQQQLQQHQQPPHLFQMGGREKTIQHLFPLEENVIQQQPNRPSSSSHPEWQHQSFINNSHSIPSNAGYWSSTSNNNGGSAGPSVNPTQWHDIPGYDPPPSS